MSKKFETFFYYKIKYFKSSAVDTTLTQQNISDKLLKVGKKKWYISKKRKVKKWCQLWVKVKTSYNLSLNVYYEINYYENIVKVILKWLYSSLF